MAKKNNKKMVNLLLAALGILTAVLSFVSLAFNFITVKTTGNITASTVKTDWSLNDWLEKINTWQDNEKIGNWQLARVFFFLTLVLVGILAVLLLIKFVFSHKILRFTTIAVGIVTVISAIFFLIMTITGAGALSGKLLTIDYQYSANLGVYFLTAMSILTAILAESAVAPK